MMVSAALAALAATPGCGSGSVKDDFLADLPDTAGADGAEVAGDVGGDATSDTGGGDTATTSDGQTTTEVVDAAGDATADVTPTDTSDAGGDTTAGDAASGASDAIVADVPVATDVVIPPAALEGLGWHAAMGASLTVGAPVVTPSGVALPVVNGTAVELRAWSLDGDGLYSATLYTGTAPQLDGAAYCDGHVFVSGHELDGQRAFVARLEPEGAGLMQVSFFPKAGTTGGSVALRAPRCGGPGAWVQLEPVGAVTYKADGGGTVQLSAEQTLNRSFIVDLDKAFSETGTLGTVSADKIAILESAVAEPAGGAPGGEVFYVGQVRVEKQLGEITLQPGDQLIYAHDYGDESGGTATNVAYYGDNDVRGITAAPDGRFAIYWRAIVPPPASVGEEQRVTAFDADGKQIGTTIVPKEAPIGRISWQGEDLVVAGTFTGAPPFPGDNHTAGTWLAVIRVGAAMTVTRSAAFGGETALLGALHRVELEGACSGAGWAIGTASAGAASSWRVVALGDGGADCTSARFDASGGGLQVTPIDDGEYVVASDAGAGLALDGGADWPSGGPEVFVGLVRARVGYASAP